MLQLRSGESNGNIVRILQRTGSQDHAYCAWAHSLTMRVTSLHTATQITMAPWSSIAPHVTAERVSRLTRASRNEKNPANYTRFFHDDLILTAEC